MAASCKIKIFDCKKEEDRRIISFLQGVAASQKHYFHHIFPWESKCVNQRIYVSYSGEINIKTPPTICGWLNLYIEKDKYLKRGYITQLSARAAKDINFKGIGSSLIKAVDDDAKNLKLNFIYLNPLENVIGFYKKQAYDYISPAKKIMIKVFGKQPLKEWLERYEKISSPDDNDNVNDIIEELLEIDEKLTQKLKGLIKKDKEQKYTLLSIYEKNQDIYDVIEWLEEF